jgi:Spy/CpxP family protein refolding chaperone
MSQKRVIAWALRPAVALAATAALAQAPGVGRGGADRPAASRGDGPTKPASPSGDRRPRGAVTPVLLIGQPAVQAELKLRDAQRDRIRDLNAEFDQKRREVADRLTAAQGALDRDAFLALIAGLRRENEEALARVLDKPQRERLAQIGLQLEGPMAVTRPEVAERLNLDDAQWLQVQALKEQYESAREQLYAAVPAERINLGAAARRPAAGARPGAARPGPRPGESAGDRLNRASDELRVRFVRELNKILTRRQKAAFNTMLGAPFDLAKVQFRGGQGGPVSLPPADAPVILEPVAPLNGPAPAAAGSTPRR